MIRILFCVLFSSFLVSKDLPNDVRWVTSSKEYKFSCHQTFNTASIMLDEYLKNNKNKNLAIVMDLDETVLDNSQYQVEIFNKGESFNMKSWSKWVKRAEADLVPGSKAFINRARALGYQLIFISNRMDKRLKSTKQNMRNLGVFHKDDIYLLRLNKKDTKDIRRSEVYKGTNRMAMYGPFEVMMYLGDAMGDFNRIKSFRKNFIFPNPMYGKW